MNVVIATDAGDRREGPSSTIEAPARARPELEPKLSDQGTPIRESVDPAWVQLQSAPEVIGIENQRRLAQLRVPHGPEEVPCYFTKSDHWVVDLRNEEAPRTLADVATYLKIPRVAEFVESSQRGDILVRTSDRSRGPTGEASVRYLESRGVVTALQTDDNPHGVAPFLDHDGKPVGFGLESKNPVALRLIKLPEGRRYHVNPPEDNDVAGFRARTTYNSVLIVLDNGTWAQTQIIPGANAVLNLADATAVQYAQAGFEGIAATYDGRGNVVIFRLEDNARRFQDTCRRLGFPALPVEQFLEAVTEAVRLNGDYVPREQGTLYIRPFLAGLEGGAGASSATRAIVGVEVWPFDVYHPKEGIYVQGRLDLSRPESGSSKLASNYGPGFDHKQRAKESAPIGSERNFSDLLYFSPDGRVEELFSAAIFFVREKEGKLSLITPAITRKELEELYPAGSKGDEASQVETLRALEQDGLDVFVSPSRTRALTVLPSITRQTMIDVARAFGIEVDVRDVFAKELKEDSSIIGACGTGTAAGVVTIAGIEIQRSEGDPNPFFLDLSRSAQANQLVQRLAEILSELRKGRVNDPAIRSLAEEREWFTSVPLDTSGERHG